MAKRGDTPAGGDRSPPKLTVVSRNDFEPSEEDFERMAESESGRGAGMRAKTEQDRDKVRVDPKATGKPQEAKPDLTEEEMQAKRWRSALITVSPKGGAYKKHLFNILIPLRRAAEWRGMFRYNAFSHTIDITRALPWNKPDMEFEKRQWNDHDDLMLSEWMNKEGLDVSSKQCSDAVYVVAKENEFHPVREYFDRIKWDGENRLTSWLFRYLGAADGEYERMVGPRIWVSMVARVMEPGCKADCVPIYIGEQGQRKSTALRVMVGPDWFTDQIGGISGGKETSIAMSGKLLVEFSDLEGFHGKTAEELKAFLSRNTDRYRAMFGRYAADYPRQVCFAGTTNQKTPLKDFTGNRRYWPIRTGAADVEAIEKDRDQLWAEAVARYHKGDPWWLDTPEARALAAEVAEDSREVDILEEEIEAYLTRILDKETTVGRIIETVMEKELVEATRADQMRVAGCLQALKWERVHKKITDANGTRRQWVYRPTLSLKSKP